MERTCALREKVNVGFLPTGQREWRRKGAVKNAGESKVSGFN